MNELMESSFISILSEQNDKLRQENKDLKYIKDKLYDKRDRAVEILHHISLTHKNLDKDLDKDLTELEKVLSLSDIK